MSLRVNIFIVPCTQLCTQLVHILDMWTSNSTLSTPILSTFSLHPRYLLQEIMELTGNTFSMVHHNTISYTNSSARLVHNGVLLESKVSTVKCASHRPGKCMNVVNMRTWWRIPSTNPPVLSPAIICTNCGMYGHSVVHCAEKVGYIRLSFLFNHINRPRNILVPRHLPEAEPAALLLPISPILPSDELVDSLFKLI